MARATRVLGRGGWSGEPADTVVLGYEDRHRREGRFAGVRGLAFDLALAEPLTLRGGDALSLDDGRLVEVVSAPEALLEVRCGSPEDLARLAWMLGDRHAPIQILGQKLRLRDDPSLKAVTDHLGLRATPIEAPFDPEGGAYAPETIVETHDHGHACGCGHHDHDHGHAHEHGHDHKHHGHGHHDHGHHDHGGGCCGGHAHHDHAHHDHAHHDHAHHDHGEGCGCAGKR